MTNYYFQCGGCGVHVQHLPRCTFTHAEFSESPPPEREHMREMQAEIERLRAEVRSLVQMMVDEHKQESIHPPPRWMTDRLISLRRMLAEADDG